MENNNLKSSETIIRSQLKSLGYFNIEIKNEHEKSFNVIADGTFRNIFLQVIIYFVSDHISKLSVDEINKIKHNANSIHKEPWAAIMKINETGQLVESIHWTNLSKHSFQD